MPLLFSYGTLQEERVQMATFGRLLVGQKDELVGFEVTLVKIEGPRASAETGKTHHANIRFNGRNESRVSGTAFEVTDAELAAADEYEAPASYKRMPVTLASRQTAWVYVHTPQM
ncbi:MAG TPA: gamma-glutamylcyclotransferase family protein [Candidatus Acidoferrales bacterium]|nr:gamma-glutamylcyclotransferase family protein [Candidatus Acidoferrales bacterium]